MHIFSSLFSGLIAAIINFTGDWFIAITLVTIGLKLLLLPLSIKQHRSQLLTANLNQVKVLLTDKFHNKTEKVNNELSRIGVKYGANPLFSFIPLLIQAPVLFSLYFSVLNLSTTVGSILLPWVSSLHSMDNLHILPMIAGLFQGLGGLANETRNFTFLVLPILFGVVFLWKAPAALSAYWIVSSALRFLEAKLFTLKPVRTKLLKIPTPEEMIANTL